MGNANHTDFVHLWAKYNQDTKQTHPLIYHMIDTGYVVGWMWDLVLTEPIKIRFSSLFQLGLPDTKQLLMMTAALHDIGKATMAFQSSIPELYERLKQKGFTFSKRTHYTPLRHDLLSSWCFLEVNKAPDLLFANELDADMIASVLGGHHGSYQSVANLNSPHRDLNLEDRDWQEMRKTIYQQLLDVFSPKTCASIVGDIGEIQAALIILTGLIVTADWISSDDNFFPYHSFEKNGVSLEAYCELSMQRSKEALRITGWNAWMPDTEPIAFEKMFGFDANTLQVSVMDLEKSLTHPFLALIEAPTGQGKTEAALYLCDRKIQRNQLRGMYIAMPSMATSNQMYGRTASFLDKRFPHDIINLQLAHSQAQWTGSQTENQLDSIGQDAQEEFQHIAAMAWFLPKKKTLLAPFGVGTVDQSLMSVLKTKHFFLRLFGLSHKVIVFDEVHAYDVYMSTLFLRLLEWLKLLHTSVVILSATLPISTKQGIIHAFSGKRLDDTSAGYYPSLTTVDEEHVITSSISGSPEQEYKLQFIGMDAETICKHLSMLLENGGCAAVIVNTVKRAQDVYRAIKTARLIDENAQDEKLVLFHARFPMQWRQATEEKVLRLFGKDGERPGKAIIIATQVLEQSLDLDFDVMISDIAPIDLLIQRAGRLQRHAARQRPQALQKALFHVCIPEDSAAPDYGASKYIYDEEILYATQLVLQGKAHMRLPEQTRELIEQVYDPALRSSFSDEQVKKLNDLALKRMATTAQEQQAAMTRIIPHPGDDELLKLGKMELEEDNPEIHQAFQALTRLIPPSVSLICLLESDGCIWDLDKNTKLNLDEIPPKELSRVLLRAMVNITNRFLVSHFNHVATPDGWKKSPILQHCKPVLFHDGIYAIDDARNLVLDQELGLFIKEDA
jgi:CRISPR-associated endonuclease/helicase Cas3